MNLVIFVLPKRVFVSQSCPVSTGHWLNREGLHFGPKERLQIYVTDLKKRDRRVQMAGCRTGCHIFQYCGNSMTFVNWPSLHFFGSWVLALARCIDVPSLGGAVLSSTQPLHLRLILSFALAILLHFWSQVRWSRYICRWSNMVSGCSDKVSGCRSEPPRPTCVWPSL
jgi:hypothetical protein